MDAVVLMDGFDKRVPARLRAAVSANVPAIQLIGGPMMTERRVGIRLGICTACRRFWHQFRARTLDRRAIGTVEGRFVPAAGTCPIMGTASRMACVAEAPGLTIPDTAAIPAAHEDRLLAAVATGHEAFRLIERPVRSGEILMRASVGNALFVVLPLGGSADALIHLAAIAAGPELSVRFLAVRIDGNHIGMGQPQAHGTALHRGLLQCRRAPRGSRETLSASGFQVPDGDR